MQIYARGRRAAWLALIGVTFLLRLPAVLHRHPIDDENMYAAVAVELVHGGLPYVSAIERKPPLLLWLYAGTLRMLGDYNWLGLHTVATLWLIASMFGLYRFARRLWGEAAGFSAALLYAVFMPWGTFINLAWNGEMLMNLPIIVALLAALRCTSPLRLSWAGALIGIAALLKQPAAISLVPLGLYVAILSYRSSAVASDDPSIKRALSSLLPTAWLALGFASVLAVMALVLYRLGILQEALYWSVLDHDVPHGPLSAVFWRRALPATAGFAVACAPLFWGAVRAAENRGAYFKGARAEYVMLLSLLGVSALGAAASGRFYPHYFLQLLPPLCLLCAPVAAGLYSQRTTPQGMRRWRLAAGYVGATALVFFSLHTATAVRASEPNPASAYLRQHCGPEDRVFVWGQSPEIYVDSRCRPASRYVATFPLTGYIFGSPLNQDPSYDTTDRIVAGSWQTLEGELRERPPAFIVDADGARPVPRYPIRNQPLLQSMLDSSYALVLRARDGLVYERKR